MVLMGVVGEMAIITNDNARPCDINFLTFQMLLVKKMVIVTIGSMGLVAATNESMVQQSKWIIGPNSYKWTDFVAASVILFQDLITSLIAMLDLVMLVL